MLSRKTFAANSLKFLCEIYVFTGNSFVATLSICQMLIRLMWLVDLHGRAFTALLFGI